MNRYDPIDRWIARFPRRQQLVLASMRIALFAGLLLFAYRGCK